MSDAFQQWIVMNCRYLAQKIPVAAAVVFPASNAGLFDSGPGGLRIDPQHVGKERSLQVASASSYLDIECLQNARQDRDARIACDQRRNIRPAFRISLAA